MGLDSEGGANGLHLPPGPAVVDWLLTLKHER